MYGDFAYIYDALMDDVDYGEWAAHYLRLIGAGGERMSICECGCGTGSMSVRLAAAGHVVTGVDISEAMLGVAAEKARGAGVSIALSEQDMRVFKLHRPVDAVIAPCDSVNYLTRPDDVRRFFVSAAANLKPGGILAFDYSTRHKLRDIVAGTFLGEDRGDIAYMWQSDYDEATHIVDMDMTFFVKQRGEIYRRFDERHLQRAHGEDEIVIWLEESGFTGISLYGEMTESPPQPCDQRVHVSATRAKDNITEEE